MNKLVIGILAIIIVAFGYMYKSSNDKSERLTKEAIEYEQKRKQEALDSIQAEKILEQKRIEKEKNESIHKDKLEQDQIARIKENEEEKNKSFQIERDEFKKFKEILNKWMTQDNIAGSTARIAVSSQVTELRKIKDELNSSIINGCLKEGKSKLLSAMEDEILMFVYFMQNDISTIKERDKLKISYFNKLADAIEIQNSCKGEYGENR